LADIRKFVQDLQPAAAMAGPLPPIVLATLRKPMVKLAGEIAQGAVWANAARSHMGESLKALPPEKQQDKNFIVANMIPTVIDDDKAAAAAVNRKTLSSYVRLPNYQQYWIEAGFEEEMQAIQKAIEKKEDEKIPQLMSDRWLSQVTLYGNAKEVREGVEAWYASGVNTLIVVPSSARGNQMVALEQVITAFQ
jgi:alkanesulfonate monooxygenase SsuD/methylene tetrahydromethanopterin reductase-like flavin-dependent oxidoreductase (luciferase family)